MASRRLIAILLVLLFLSSLAAALAPVQESGKSVSTSSSETSTTQASPGAPAVPAQANEAEPRLIRQSVDASREKPPAIKARVGDQLELRVTSQRSGTVELAGIGPTEDVGPRQPAFFDVLLREDGTHRVRFLETGREIALIVVSEPDAESPPR